MDELLTEDQAIELYGRAAVEDLKKMKVDCTRFADCDDGWLEFTVGSGAGELQAVYYQTDDGLCDDDFLQDLEAREWTISGYRINDFY